MPQPAANLTHAGRTQSRAAWSAETGIPIATIRSRLKRGWSVATALTIRPDRRFAKGGRKKRDAVRPCPELQRHADGRAFARWGVGGKEVWRTFGPWGSAAAKLAYRRFALEWAAGQTGAGDGAAVTVGELVVGWLAHCAATYRKRDRITSEVHCNRAAMRPFAELYGDEPAAEFTPLRLLAVREAMVANGWVRKTVNDHVGRIVRAFAWAATSLGLPATVHAALALVEPLAGGRRADLAESEPVEPVPAEHIAAVLAGTRLHFHDGRRAVLASMIRVQLLTGLRPGELCGLTAGGIDRAREPWRCAFSESNKMLHKNITRVAFFGPLSRAALAPLLAGAAPGDPVFRLPPVRRGAKPAPVTTRYYRDCVADACARAKVPAWTPNQLRHNRATEVMDRYEDDRAVGSALGNSPEVSRQVYAHRPGEAVARRIAEATG